MKILIVSNYLPDQQQSMLRFSRLLEQIYCIHFETYMVSPPYIFGSISFLGPRVCKYLSYVDKLVLFPIYLFFKSLKFDFMHIADHGNSFYSFCCPKYKSIVTCHDLLAMRAAFGDQSIPIKTSLIGVYFQKLIKLGLSRVGSVYFVSMSTFKDYQKLFGTSLVQRQSVIPIALNASFSPDTDSLSLTSSEIKQIPSSPYLLMVGSSSIRKNRRLSLKLLSHLDSYHLVFAGDSLTLDELNFARLNDCDDRLISIVRPSHSLLNFLYNNAHALLFPSFAEGFGWPLVEAQFCHCPVITSLNSSIGEVAGDGALYADPTDVSGFIKHIKSLEDTNFRSHMIQLGSYNSLNYSFDKMSDSYCSLLLSCLND